MATPSREPITLFDDVPGGEEIRETRKAPESGTVEKVWLRNYIGHGFDLRYDVRIKHDGRWRSVFEHLGKDFITGDGDTREFDLREQFEEGDKIQIVANNNEPEYLYHANASVTVDYDGGPVSLISDALGGVL